MKKLGAVPNDAMRSPLITGPIIRPDETTALFNATALGKSASPTRSLTKLSNAGLSIDMIRPSNRAAALIIHKSIRSVTTDNPIAAASSARALCVQSANGGDRTGQQ